MHDPWADLWAEMRVCLDMSTVTLRYNTKDAHQEAAVLLHSRIVALCAAVFRELEAGKYTCTPIILRSAIEAFVDFISAW